MATSMYDDTGSSNLVSGTQCNVGVNPVMRFRQRGSIHVAFCQSWPHVNGYRPTYSPRIPNQALGEESLGGSRDGDGYRLTSDIERRFVASCETRAGFDDMRAVRHVHEHFGPGAQADHLPSIDCQPQFPSRPVRVVRSPDKYTSHLEIVPQPTKTPRAVLGADYVGGVAASSTAASMPSRTSVGRSAPTASTAAV